MDPPLATVEAHVLHTRRSAELLGARYREIPVEGGHMWMFGRWDRFRHDLVRAAA